MMIDNIMCSTEMAVERAFDDPNSKESKAFFAGARAIMAALEEISADQHAQMLAFKNQQHIMAVLATGKHQREERKRQEALVLVGYCHIDKAKLRGFLFDAPAISDDGRAMGVNGEFLEDENYTPIPGIVNPGWPECTIYNIDSGEKIGLEKYNQLLPEEREQYSRYKTLTFRSSSNRPTIQIHDFDHEIIEELIRRDIMIGDPVNDRYFNEAIMDREDKEPGALYGFRNVILEALTDLGPQMHRHDDVPLVFASPKTGRIFKNDLEVVWPLIVGIIEDLLNSEEFKAYCERTGYVSLKDAISRRKK